MHVKNSSYVGVVIILDGSEFEGCTFERCLLVYGGGPLPKLSGCTFRECSWKFESAAERTIMLIRAFAQIMGQDGEKFIENIFLRPLQTGPQPPALTQPQ